MIHRLAPAAALAALLALPGVPCFAAGATGYVADPAQSKLEFTGVQAGAEFKGQFRKFTAAVDFSAEALDASKIDVQVDLASEDTQDKDRDDTIRGPDIFDASHAPTARYVTRSIAKSGNGYAAQGALTLRGVTKDVPIQFQFTPGAGGARLQGTAQLKRLDFGVGRGDWKSTEWVADLVKVSFNLALKPKG